MAEISHFWLVKHLRAETSSHILLSKGGRQVVSGRGLSFWFLPMSSSIAEVPVDDRELPVLFHGRSKDYQDVTTQGAGRRPHRLFHRFRQWDLGQAAAGTGCTAADRAGSAGGVVLSRPQ